MWQIEEAGPKSAAWNMHIDQERLAQLTPDSYPWLRFYEWESPAATYGYFLDPTEYFKPQIPLQLARRPTGGGIIFHTCDLAFCIGVPASHPFYAHNTLQSYAQINKCVLNALQIKGELLMQPTNAKIDFCMAKPTIYDLIIHGRKVGGAAQRKTKQGLLHQGSLCLALPPKSLIEEVLHRPQIYETMQQMSFTLAPDGADLELFKNILKAQLIKHICSRNTKKPSDPS